MEYFVVSQVVRLTHSVYNDSSVLTNAATVSLTVTLPDGTTATPAVTNTDTGQYRVDYAATQAGRYTYVWSTTSPTAPDDGSFDVHPVTQGFVSLGDAKAHLNITTTTDDEELRGFIEAATRVVEDHVGPVVVRAYAEVHDGGPWLVTHRAPVLSLTSLVPVLTSGTSYVVADLDLDPATGVIRRRDGAGFTGPLRVTYTAGRRVVPASMALAAKIIVGHLWETQRGHAGPRAGFGEDDVLPTGRGFAVPRRALELLAPDQREPAVA